VLPELDLRTGRPQRRSEVGWPFHLGRGNDSEDVELFVS